MTEVLAILTIFVLILLALLVGHILTHFTCARARNCPHYKSCAWDVRRLSGAWRYHRVPPAEKVATRWQ